MKLKAGDLIKYNYLYSNEDEKIGIIIDIKTDINFGHMIFITHLGYITGVPYSLMDFEIID